MAYAFTVEEILELLARFEAIDYNSDGSLSRAEWKAALLAGLDHTAEDFDLADINSDDSLSFPEYVKLVSEIYKRQGAPRKARLDAGLTWKQVWDAYDVFEKADTKRCGSLTSAELAKAIGQPVDSQVVMRIMTIFDRDDTNRISLGDYLQGVQLGIITLPKTSRPRQPANKAPPPPPDIPEKIRLEAEAAFHQFDSDHSGTINTSEFAELMKIINPKLRGPDINRLYATVDIDKSGLITLNEFLLGCAMGFIDISKLSSSSGALSTTDYEWEIPFKELKFGTKLGEGTFGVVYKGTWRGTTVAIKTLKVEMSDDVVKDFRDEIAILGKLRHPCVILFMGACTQAPNFCIVTEFMDAGSVYDAMHKRKVELKRAHILKMATQIAQGINYLHNLRNQIVHRDLKSLNCLVDDYWNVKVADFGLSCIKSGKDLRGRVGTPAFMAPELLQGKAYNEKVDVYSFAMCLWELVTGEFPFDRYGFEDLVQIVPSGQRPKIPSSCGPELEDLITRCWANDPAQRPNFDEIITILENMKSRPELQKANSDKFMEKLKTGLKISNLTDPFHKKDKGEKGERKHLFHHKKNAVATEQVDL